MFTTPRPCGCSWLGDHIVGNSLLTPTLAPGDEGHRQAEGSEAWGTSVPAPARSGDGAGGLDRGSRPGWALALRGPPPPAHKAPFTGRASAEPPPWLRRWLTPLSKQTAPGLVGAAGYRGWILPAGRAARQLPQGAD